MDMKYLKTFESVNWATPNDLGIDKTIQFTMDQNAINRYHPLQMDTKDKSVNKEFMTFCEKLATHSFVDALGGSDAPSDAFHRYRTDKTFEEVIDFADTAIAAGIKIVHFPQWEMNEWEKWPDGYIESFIRMDSEERFKEYFIWQYIKMEHLRNILTEFQNDLIFSLR